MKVNKFSRGQIWYLEDDADYDGYVQGKTRPVIIVSNNLNNSNSNNVTVVPLTTQIKRLDMSTHVLFWINNRQNMTICECIKTVNNLKLIDYVGVCDDELMCKIDEAIKIALGLKQIPDYQINNIDIPECEVESQTVKDDIEIVNTKPNKCGRKPLIPIGIQAQFIQDLSCLNDDIICNKYSITSEQLKSQKKRATKLLEIEKEKSL